MLQAKMVNDPEVRDGKPHLAGRNQEYEDGYQEIDEFHFK